MLQLSNRFAGISVNFVHSLNIELNFVTFGLCLNKFSGILSKLLHPSNTPEISPAFVLCLNKFSGIVFHSLFKLNVL